MSRATPEQIAALPHCQKCQRYMRPHHTVAADWPGATARGNLTTCSTCVKRARDAMIHADHADHADRERARDIRTAVNLRAFLTERRRRGIPAEGLRVDA